ncbi:hypothetical protein GIB67_013364, partial [Kingdonia uniflora]
LISYELKELWKESKLHNLKSSEIFGLQASKSLVYNSRPQHSAGMLRLSMMLLFFTSIRMREPSSSELQVYNTMTMSTTN